VGSVLKAKGRAGQELTLAQKLHAVEQARIKNMEAGGEGVVSLLCFSFLISHKQRQTITISIPSLLYILGLQVGAVGGMVHRRMLL
jgi:hypothetical protein